MDDREKVIKGLRCLSNPYIQDMDERDCENCKYDNACCFLDVTADALSLLKAQEQEIQQLKVTHISASGNAIACGVIRGGVTINQKAKEITNIKHVETFNG